MQVPKTHIYCDCCKTEINAEDNTDYINLRVDEVVLFRAGHSMDLKAIDGVSGACDFCSQSCLETFVRESNFKLIRNTGGKRA